MQIVNQPYKVGWDGDGLYLEAHPPLESSSAAVQPDMTAITQAYVAATGTQAADVDWDMVSRVFQRRSGRPVRIGERSEPVQQLADNLRKP